MGILCFVLFVVTQVTLNNIVLNTKLLEKRKQKKLMKLFRVTYIFLEKIVCAKWAHRDLIYPFDQSKGPKLVWVPKPNL